MKIENGKLIYEIVTCWSCEGVGKQKQYPSCPHNYKTVKNFPGHKCPHCGAKNKHSHKHEETPILIDCHGCQCTGRRQENEYDWVSKEVWAEMVKRIKFSVSRKPLSAMTFTEQYIGDTQSVFGCTDYGAANQLTDEQILAKIPLEHTPPQPILWVKPDGTLPTEIVIIVKSNGYMAYPTKY